MDPNEPIDDDLTPEQDAIAADRETGFGSYAGEGRDADTAAARYERWLDTWP